MSQDETVRLQQTDPETGSKLYQRKPEFDPHFPVENISRSVVTFGDRTVAPGDRIMLPLDWAMSLADDRNFRVWLRSPPVPIQDGQILRVKRHLGWGDILFALAGVWHLKKQYPAVEVWFDVPFPHEEWLRWVPFVKVAPGPTPDNFVNLDAINHTVLHDRILEMARSLGVPYKGRHTPEYPFPIDVPDEPAPGFPPDAVYGYMAPWSRDKRGPRSVPPEVLERFLRDYSERCNIPLVVGDNKPHEFSKDLGHLIINKTQAVELTPAAKMLAIKRAKFVISTDTGPLHVATLLKRPVLGIFSHIDPAHRLSLVKTPYETLTPGLACFPCGDAAPPPCAAEAKKDPKLLRRCAHSYSADDIFAALGRLRDQDGELAAHLTISGLT